MVAASYGRTAVVHEWVSALAGSEQVFGAMARAFPEADLFALSVEESVDLGIPQDRIRTTWLDRPALRDRRGLTLPLMPLAWRSLRAPSRYDLVLTSHHAFASSNRLTRPGGRHFLYVHSPARYVWSPEIDERGASPLLAPARAVLRRIDRRAAARVTGIAANSRAVADRVRTSWGREAVVIHPPVDVDFFSGPATAELELPDEFLLSLGRWIPYKRHDLVIRAAALCGLPAVIAGSGPEKASLQRLARELGSDVVFVESPTRAQVRELYGRALCLVFPAYEDFGIVPVEAQAAGTPVVALDHGGTAETVRDGVTGALVPEASAAVLAEAVTRTRGLSPDDCRAHAAGFAPERFAAELRAWVQQ